MPFGMSIFARRNSASTQLPAAHAPSSASRRRVLPASVIALVAVAGASVLTAPPALAATTAPSSSSAGAGILRAKPTRVIEGDVTLTGNQSLKDTIVHGRVLVKGTNNVVENNIVTGRTSSGYTSGTWLVDTQWATNAVVRYNTIQAVKTSAYVNGVGLRNVTVERNDISQVIDGVDVSPATSGGSANMTITGNYIHDLMFYGNDPTHGVTRTPLSYTGPWANKPWSHDDGIQIMSGNGVKIVGNTINAQWSTKVGTLPLPTIRKQLSAVMINSPRGAVSGLAIQNNWLDYGEATINGLGGSGSVTITGNRFGRHYAAYPMWFARSFSVSSASNVFSDVGSLINVVWS
jgi:hypothetical protein